MSQKDKSPCCRWGGRAHSGGSGFGAIICDDSVPPTRSPRDPCPTAGEHTGSCCAGSSLELPLQPSVTPAEWRALSCEDQSIWPAEVAVPALGMGQRLVRWAWLCQACMISLAFSFS